MNILGINAYHGNASAAIVCDGKLIAAVEEERFNRVKYAAGFPAAAIRYCLKEAGLKLNDIDHVAVPRNPYARMATKLAIAIAASASRIASRNPNEIVLRGISVSLARRDRPSSLPICARRIRR